MAVSGGVDKDCGGGSGGGDEREGVVGDGERLRGRREWDVWTEAMEGSGLRAKATFCVDVMVRLCFAFVCHGNEDAGKLVRTSERERG